METQQDGNEVYRCVARTNMEINKYWLCDDGRFNYQYTMDRSRVTVPMKNGIATEWTDTVSSMKAAFKGKKPTVLVGSDLTLEEGKMILEFAARNFQGSPVLHFGTPGITSAAQDKDEDKILKRTSKTSNLHGMEKLGLKGFESLPSGTDSVIIFRGGRAQLPKLTGVSVHGVGVFMEEEVPMFKSILPGTSFVEKDGTIVNYQGKEQRLRRAVNPLGQSKQLSEILMMWMHSGQSASQGVVA